MQAGAAVADLRAGHQRRAVVESGGRGRSAGALRNVLVYLALFVRSGTKAFDRGHDHAGIEFLDAFPGESHTIQRSGREIFHQNVAMLHQSFQHLLALLTLGVERHGALVVIEHREIQAVRIRHITQLLAGDIPGTGLLDLDHIGTEPSQQLRTRRTRLHVCEIENAYAV